MFRWYIWKRYFSKAISYILVYYKVNHHLIFIVVLCKSWICKKNDEKWNEVNILKDL